MGNITVHTKTHGFGDTFIEIQYKGHPLFSMTDEDARELNERLNEHYNNNLQKQIRMTEEIKMVYELTEQIESFNSRLRSIERYLGLCTVEKKGNVIIAQHDPSFDNVHHCGQDADEHQPAGYTYKDLLGMEVIGIGGMAAQSCVYCGDADCVKVELVGGDFMCLKKREEDKVLYESPELSMIKKQTEGFLSYLDNIVKGK